MPPFPALKRAEQGHAVVRDTDTRRRCGFTRPSPTPPRYPRSHEHALLSHLQQFCAPRPAQELTRQHIYEGPSQSLPRTSPNPTPYHCWRFPPLASIYGLLDLEPLSLPILRATPYQELNAQRKAFFPLQSLPDLSPHSEPFPLPPSRGCLFSHSHQLGQSLAVIT